MMLTPCSRLAAHYLTELHAALVEDPLDEQLEEAVAARPEASLAQLPVRGNELCHHGAGLFEAVHACRARVPVLELGVVGEAGQREEETQLAVVLLGGTALLQTVEALDCLLHAELQLRPTECLVRTNGVLICSWLNWNLRSFRRYFIVTNDFVDSVQLRILFTYH